MDMGTSLLPQLDLFADPVRARLLLLLEPRELSVGDLGEVLQLPQPTMSRHLKALADQGWVTSRADGTSRLYRANTRSQSEALGELWRLVRAEVEGSAEVRKDLERVRHVLAQRQAREGFFDGAAGEWDELRTELFAPRFELLGLLGLMDPSWTVGDLGCGTGHFALAAASFVKQVIAVDGSSAMLDVARTRLAERNNVELRQGDLASLPIADASLDLAVLNLVLPYAGDPGQVIREAARVLKPGCRVLVVDLQPHDQVELRQRFGQQWQGFSAATLRTWFDEAQLTAVRQVALPAEPHARGPLLFTAVAFKSSPEGAPTRSVS
jgi:ArsR family transcriptional regulator